MIPLHTHLIIFFYLFRFGIILTDFLGSKIQSVSIEYMELVFIIFYQKIDKVGIEAFCLVQIMLLLEQLVLGGKLGSLINFALLDNLTAFADIPAIIQYLFLGAYMLTLFVVEHIACGNLFYGFR